MCENKLYNFTIINFEQSLKVLNESRCNFGHNYLESPLSHCYSMQSYHNSILYGCPKLEIDSIIPDIVGHSTVDWKTNFKGTITMQNNILIIKFSILINTFFQKYELLCKVESKISMMANQSETDSLRNLMIKTCP